MVDGRTNEKNSFPSLEKSNPKNIYKLQTIKALYCMGNVMAIRVKSVESHQSS
jgi:hypothetical protein